MPNETEKQGTTPAIPIGVVGAGHLGRFHIECLQRIPGFDLVGFLDTDPGRREEIAAKYALHAFKDYDSLLGAVEAVCIVTPTSSHYDLAQAAIEAGKHVFVEKPLTADPVTSRTLAGDMARSGKAGRVGHVERYNPAFVAAMRAGIRSPRFVEAHRLAPFNPRGMDVSVVMDLMIHDIDLVLSTIGSPVDHIEANGVAVAGKTADLCNARITFRDGSVANLTASRISLKQMRKLRLFQPNQYMSIDFLAQEVQVVQLFGDEPTDKLSMKLELADGTRWIAADNPMVTKHNAIEEELRDFRIAIDDPSHPGVTFEDGARAVEVAHRIMEQLAAYEQI